MPASIRSSGTCVPAAVVAEAARAAVPSTALGAGRGGIDQLMPLGEYTITLTAGGRTLSTKGQIVHTQGWPLGTPSSVIR